MYIHIVLAVVLFLAPKIIQPPADFHMVTFNELTSSVRLMCSLNIAIPSSVTIVWTHNGNAVMAMRRKQAMQNGNTQSWESYFSKVIYYILLFTFCKSNALQLHIT